MGYGDKLMAIGDAWALHQADPGKRKVAIGNGVILDPQNMDLCWGLDHFLVTPETYDWEHPLWVHSYAGHRPYHDREAMKARLREQGFQVDTNPRLLKTAPNYAFNYNYRPTPAPLRLTPGEQAIAEEWSDRPPFVVLEAFIKKDAPPSKQWPVERFVEVARRLNDRIQVYQIAAPDRAPIGGVEMIRPRSFRGALPYLKAAALYIGPEGGLHHASAAMGTKAVVTFGGFTPPAVTGYDFHANLTGGAERFCGTRYGMCPHCAEHLDAISVDDVLAAADRLIS